LPQQPHHGILPPVCELTEIFRRLERMLKLVEDSREEAKLLELRSDSEVTVSWLLSWWEWWLWCGLLLITIPLCGWWWLWL